jgi:hypothetical protein
VVARLQAIIDEAFELARNHEEVALARSAESASRYRTRPCIQDLGEMYPRTYTDPAAIRTGRAMSMPRLESRCPCCMSSAVASARRPSPVSRKPQPAGHQEVRSIRHRPQQGGDHDGYRDARSSMNRLAARERANQSSWPCWQPSSMPS